LSAGAAAAAETATAATALESLGNPRAINYSGLIYL